MRNILKIFVITSLLLSGATTVYAGGDSWGGVGDSTYCQSHYIPYVEANPSGTASTPITLTGRYANEMNDVYCTEPSPDAYLKPSAITNQFRIYSTQQVVSNIDGSMITAKDQLIAQVDVGNPDTGVMSRGESRTQTPTSYTFPASGTYYYELCSYEPPGETCQINGACSPTGGGWRCSWNGGDMMTTPVYGYITVGAQYCTSSANACGQTNYGICPQSPPANPAGYGNACNSAPNSCGQTNPGTIQCNGSCSATPPSDATCIPSTPTGLSASCNAAGTSATFSWTPTPGATYYYFRNDDQQISSCGSWYCQDPPDTISGQYGSNSYTINGIVPGHGNSWWVHSGNAGGYSAPTYGYTVCAGQPDLTAGSVTPTTATVNQLATFSATVTNGSGASTGAGFTNRWDLDLDTDHSSVYTTLTDTSPALAPSGTDVTQMTYTFGSSGTFYWRVCADNNTSWQGSITESNESNNCGAWTNIVMNPAPQPDLTASNLSPSGGTSVTPGSATTFQGRINNIGNATASNIPNILQVCNGAAGTCTSLNTLVSAGTVASIASGANSTVSANYTFASGLSGAYSYRFCADNNTSWVGTNTESNEGNCDNWTSITVSAPTCSSFSASPTTIAAGGTSNLSWNCPSASSCTIPSVGSGGGSGSLPVSPAVTTGYSLSCNNGVTSPLPVTVNVTNPKAYITASPDRVTANPSGTTYLSWSASSLVPSSICTMTKNGSSFNPSAPGNLTADGAGVIATTSAPGVSQSITSQTTYVLTCGTAASSVIVNVVPVFDEF